MTPEEKEKVKTWDNIEKEYAAKRDAAINGTTTVSELEDALKRSAFITSNELRARLDVNPFIDDNDLRERLSVNPAAPFRTITAYSAKKPPTFELNGTIDVKTLIRNSGKDPEDVIEFPLPIRIPRTSRSDENQFNIIKESVKHLKEYREVLQILSNKNILVKGHIGTNNISLSLSDEELDKFMTCLENLNKGE